MLFFSKLLEDFHGEKFEIRLLQLLLRLFTGQSKSDCREFIVLPFLEKYFNSDCTNINKFIPNKTKKNNKFIKFSDKKK